MYMYVLKRFLSTDIVLRNNLEPNVALLKNQLCSYWVIAFYRLVVTSKKWQSLGQVTVIS